MQKGRKNKRELSASLNGRTNIGVELRQENLWSWGKAQLSAAALIYTSLSSLGEHGEHFYGMV